MAAIRRPTCSSIKFLLAVMIPVHLLAGFLGSGKTTTLKHVLENKEDVRVGVIVNDVASVNIDAKLIAQRDADAGSSSSSLPTTLGSNNNDGDIVELQNGCACCSLAGELFDSINTLLLPRISAQSSGSSTSGSNSFSFERRPASKRRRRRKRRSGISSSSSSIRNPTLMTAMAAPYDAIVVELSGVADPLAIRNQWREVVAKDSHPLVTSSAELGRIATVVDATTFGSDYMTYDVLRDREGWLGNGETQAQATLRDCSGNKQVAYLLAEQVEAADLVVINKEDLAGDEKVQVSKSMAQSLNADAELLVTSHGTISASKLLGLLSSPAATTDKHDHVDDHDHSHSESESGSHQCEDPDCTDESHSHTHAQTDHDSVDASHSRSHSHEHSDSHSHSHDHGACDDPECTDPSHSHSHSHSHDHGACDDPECTDPSHSHSHDHGACDDPECTDPSHSHSHSHSHDHGACDDPDCTDPSHSHSHDHAGDTSLANLGISSFVYKATRPFDAKRLGKLIFDWPIPIKDELDVALLRDAASTGYGIDESDNESENDEISPFVGVLRSKGFCWIAPTAWEGILADPWRHDRSMYWSHAGKHVGIQTGGPFWASLPRDTMEEFFRITQNPKECQRILGEDFVTEEFGDRRQELVFIGVDLRQTAIENALEGCLLTDAEMDGYRDKLENLKRSMKEAADAAAAAVA
eukprot:jgi/Psemu1/285205/fgenesh1_pg.77_\